MSTTTSNPAAARRSWMRRAALAAVVLVPLAFAGLFVGALGQGDDALENIPVAIVNDDTLQVTTAADGTEQNVFAGRQLVTELTGSTGFEWTITNEEDAEAALDAGEVYAILTIPSSFSDSILSLSSDNPTQADISIRTDDAHSYLTGSVAQVVGQTMTDTFGKEITAQYIGGIYASIGDLGTALTQAADGASQLADGAGSLSSGLSQYTSGVGGVASGAGDLASGVTDYAGGVNSLSSGLSTLARETSRLGELAGGVKDYTDGVSGVTAGLKALDPATPVGDPYVQQLIGGLSRIDQGSSTLAAGASGLPALQSGIAQSAAGAAQLAGGSGSLVSGANGLASGAYQLAAGSDALVSGANGLASGASELATGLQSGADQVPAGDSDAAAASAEVAADPVTLSVTTDNPVSDIGQIVATFFVPLGLWLGALAVFLVLRPVTTRLLSSTARDGRLVASTLTRASLVTGAQAVLLVALLHGALGVGWELLPATLGFSLLTAIAFTAFHYLLTVGLGRAGLVVSLFVLAIQITSTGGVYPIELLSSPFQIVSPFLPLTYAVDGMQGILAGGNPGGVLSSAVLLLAFGAVSVLLSLLVIGRARRARALGLVPTTA